MPSVADFHETAREARHEITRRAGHVGDRRPEDFPALVDDGEVDRHRGKRYDAAARKQDLVRRVVDMASAVPGSEGFAIGVALAVRSVARLALRMHVR